MRVKIKIEGEAVIDLNDKLFLTLHELMQHMDKMTMVTIPIKEEENEKSNM